MQRFSLFSRVTGLLCLLNTQPTVARQSATHLTAVLPLPLVNRSCCVISYVISKKSPSSGNTPKTTHKMPSTLISNQIVNEQISLSWKGYFPVEVVTSTGREKYTGISLECQTVAGLFCRFAVKLFRYGYKTGKNRADFFFVDFKLLRLSLDSLSRFVLISRSSYFNSTFVLLFRRAW